MTPRRRKSEGGYALLLVYAMAAAIAVMLYMEIPRVAFEAQREKEQLLIDRGEQYTRAIQLYVRKYNRFPADMRALENTQNIRFLRRQYVDPMTGKNEWRLVHVGPGGVFTDSLVHKAKKETTPQQTFITEMQQIGGGTTGTGGEGANLATRRRPSDGAVGQPDPFAPPGQINGPVMVLPDGRIVPATATGVPAPAVSTGQGQIIGQPQNGSGQPRNGQLPNGIGFQQTGNLPPGFQNTPNTPGGPPQSAANLINQILTTPRPGGLNGLDGTQPGGQGVQGGIAGGVFGTPIQGNAGGGQIIGGGIAGVASKLEREGIKLYGQRSAYNEWEFVYDMSKDASRGGGGRGGVIPQQVGPGQTSSQTSPPPPQNPPGR